MTSAEGAQPPFGTLRRSSAIIIPDAGPLITLGKSEQLSLLLLPGLPVYVVDQVVWETTRNRDFPDAVAIAGFINAYPDRVHVFRTRVGAFCERERTEKEVVRQPGMGEAAI